MSPKNPLIPAKAGTQDRFALVEEMNHEGTKCTKPFAPLVALVVSL